MRKSEGFVFLVRTEVVYSAIDLASFLLFKLQSYCLDSRAIVLDKRGIVFYDVGIVLLMIDNDSMVLPDLVQLWAK